MTIRLDDRDYAALKDESAPASEGGHWRCVFRVADGVPYHHDLPAGWLELEPHVLIAPPRFATEPEADAAGAAEAKRCLAFNGPVFSYVRAEFFPDYSGNERRGT